MEMVNRLLTDANFTHTGQEQGIHTYVKNTILVYYSENTGDIKVIEKYSDDSSSTLIDWVHLDNSNDLQWILTKFDLLPHEPPKTFHCIKCNIQIKPIHSKPQDILYNPQHCLWDGGVVLRDSGGFGSKYDMEDLIIAICDNCLDEYLND